MTIKKGVERRKLENFFANRLLQYIIKIGDHHATIESIYKRSSQAVDIYLSLRSKGEMPDCALGLALTSLYDDDYLQRYR